MMRMGSIRVLVVVGIVGSFVCALLVPAALRAAPRKPKRVSVADPSGNTAAVDADGNLKVSATVSSGAVTISGGALNLTDATTGDPATIDTDGNLKVAAVPTAPPRPVNTINTLTLSASDTRIVLFEGTGPNRLALTSITFAAEGPNPGSVRANVSVYVADGPNGDCDALTGASFGAAERFTVVLPIGTSLNIPYPSPLVLTAYADTNEKWCVDASATGPTGYNVYVSASGFLTF